MLKLLEKILQIFSYFPKKQKRPFVYVALGDSSVEGIGATSPDKSYPAILHNHLQKKHKKTEYHNLGRSGVRIKNVISEQLPRLIDLNPDLVTISIGVNDIRGRVNVKHFKKDLKYLVETIMIETNAKIVINNLPDFSLLPQLPLYLRIVAKVIIKKFNKAIETVSNEFKLVLVDIYEDSKTHAKKWRDYISEDGFHPSDAGYALWANLILRHI